MADLLTPQTIAVAVLAGAALALSFRDITKFAFAWAFTFPIDVINGVPGWVFDGLRYGGAAWVVLRVGADLPQTRRPILRNMAILLAVLATIRGSMAIVNHDQPNVRVGLMMASGTALGYLVALRTKVHPPIITGYLAGVTFSASVSVLQSLHWTVIAPANIYGSRYPGLSTYTAVFSWHAATALIVAAYLVASRVRYRDRTFWFALIVAPTCLLGLVTNGAQGGMLGVAAATLAVAWTQRRVASGKHVATVAAGALAAAIVVIGAVAVAGVDIPSISDYDRSFTNERSRIDSWQQGIEALIDHPLTGTSSHDYLFGRGNRIMPHLLPLESAAVAGIAGLVAASAVVGYLAWLILKGPVDRRSHTIAAYGVLVSLLVNTLTEPQGPFMGVGRAVPLFLIILYACVGTVASGETTEAGQAPQPGQLPNRAS